MALRVDRRRRRDLGELCENALFLHCGTGLPGGRIRAARNLARKSAECQRTRAPLARPPRLGHDWRERKECAMALTVRQQARYWGIAAAIFLALLWGLGNVILPFLVGGALAYFLDPIADRLERMGLSRAAATAAISALALLIFVLLALLIVPMLVRQLIQLVNAAPTIFGELQGFLTASFPSIMEQESVVRETLVSIGKTIQARGGELASGLLSSALSVINAVVFIVVVPVVAFYLLLDWDKMVGKIDALLPRDHAETV